MQDGVEQIGDAAFGDCHNLKKMELPQSVKSIGIHAFDYCYKLESIEIGDGVEKIGTYAFADCYSLIKFNMPKSINLIENGIFCRCSSLEEVILPSGLEKIDIYAFQDCKNIKLLEIPASVISIHDASFEGCTGVEYVINKSGCDAKVPGVWRILDEEGNLGDIYNDYVPANSICVKDGAQVSLAKLKELGSLIVKITDNGLPVEGAQVIAKEKTYTTNDKGTCVVDEKNIVDGMVIKKDDVTRTITEPSFTNKLITYEIGENIFDQIYIYNDFGRKVNLINSASTVTLKDNQELYIFVKYRNPEDTVELDKLRLIQYFKGKEQFSIESSVIGLISVNQSSLKECDYMVIEAYNQSGIIVQRQRIALRTIPDTISYEIKLGDGFEFTISENVPIFGGMTINVDDINLPIKMEANSKGELVGGCRKEFSLLKSSTWEIKAEIAAILKGSRQKYAGDIQFRIRAEGEFPYDIIIAGHIPVTMAVEVAAEGTSDGNLVLTFDNDFNLKDLYYELLLSFVGEVETRLGIGHSKIISIGVYGDAKTKFDIVFSSLRDNSESKNWKWTVEGSIGGFAKTVLSETFKFSLIQTREPIVILPKSEDSNASTFVLAPNMEELLSMTLENVYEGQISSSVGQWNGEVKNGVNVLRQDFCSTSNAKIVETQNGTYMFFIDCVDGRVAKDATAVVYSKLDKNTNTWSRPIIVEDDGTADDEPVVYASNDKIYIVWNDMETSIEEGTIVKDLMKQVHLSGAVLDTGNDQITMLDTSITKGSYKTQYGILGDGDFVYYAWIENQENSTATENSVNLLKYLASDGTIRTISESEKAPYNLVMFTVDDVAYVAYLLGDSDGNSTIHIYNLLSGTEEVLNGYNAESLQLIKQNEKDSIAWYREGSIYFWDGKQVLNVTANMCIGGMNHRVITGSDNRMAVVYESAALDGRRNLYMIKYMDGVWSNPVQITNNTGYAEHANGYFNENQVNVVYNLTQVTSDFDISSKLCEVVCLDFTDIALKEFSFDNTQFVPGNTFDITVDVANLGLTSVPDFSLQLKNYKGDILAEQNNLGTLLSGESKTVSCILQLPVDISNGKYSINLVCDGDADLSNNILYKTFGNSQLCLEADSFVYTDHYGVYGTVTNNGLNSATGMLTIYNFDTDEVYAKMLFTDLDSNSYFTFDSSELLGEDVDLSGMIGVRIETLNENVSEEACNQLIYLEDIFTEPEKPAGPSIQQGSDGNYYYMLDGNVIEYSGLKEYEGTWYCISGGQVDFGYTGLKYDLDCGWWYVEDGVINFGYNGFIFYGDAWWCVAGGRVAFEYTGLWNDPQVGWWYVENGVINFDYNGLIFYDDVWWCVAGGRVAFEYTGLWCDPQVGWWYVENGMINFDYNGLIFYGDAWWCVAGGRVAFEYTGLWNDPQVGWWYVENGMINFDYNGFVQNDAGWWCVAGGRVAFEYTGLWSDPQVGSWYVENGMINFNYS